MRRNQDQIHSCYLCYEAGGAGRAADPHRGLGSHYDVRLSAEELGTNETRIKNVVKKNKINNYNRTPPYHHPGNIREFK